MRFDIFKVFVLSFSAGGAFIYASITLREGNLDMAVLGGLWSFIVGSMGYVGAHRIATDFDDAELMLKFTKEKP